ARRGVQESTAASVRSAAPFGVAQASRPVAAPGRTVVYPAVVELGRVPLIDLAPTRDSAMHTAPRRGTGPEYLGIREYRTGDSMRHVHWPSTARHGPAMVGEFEQEHTVLLAMPTWRANAHIADAVGALRSEAGAVAVALIESHTFPSDRQAPVLSPAEVDRLAGDLQSRDVTVYRIRSKEDLAECLR